MIELRWLISENECTLQFRHYKFRGGPWQDVPEVSSRRQSIQDPKLAEELAAAVRKTKAIQLQAFCNLGGLDDKKRPPKGPKSLAVERRKPRARKTRRKG